MIQIKAGSPSAGRGRVVGLRDAGRVAVGRGLSGGGIALRWVEEFRPWAEAHVHDLVQRLSSVDVQTMLTVHALLILSACWFAFSRRAWATILAALAVIGFSLVWFGVNHRWEGRILYEVAPHHGLTEADLQVPAAIAIALVVRGIRGMARTWMRFRRERIEAGVPSVFRTMWPGSSSSPTKPIRADGSSAVNDQ
ncbi:MAG TPA: hypothetical protein VLL08_29220 [Kineosporiaceae bacterium]|nr:hypothetical protein [Kineosporiaceae bacterium]